jgi:hypothetical protein
MTRPATALSTWSEVSTAPWLWISFVAGIAVLMRS